MRIDNKHDVVSGADSDKSAVYIDRRIPQFSQILKGRGGRPANLWKYLSVHEIEEARLMAKGMGYDQAHDRATAKERQAVQADGVDWTRYTAQINGYLAATENQKVKNPPPAGQHYNMPHRHHRRQGKR